MDQSAYIQPPDLNDPQRKPFGIELVWHTEGARGHMRPRSTLYVNRSLRTSGLLLALPPEDAKMLLFALTFIHPNGYCHATVQELCYWTKLSQAKLRSRMCRLTQFEWQGVPFMTEIRRESGLDAFTPSPSVLEVTERIDPPDVPETPIRTSSREAVIMHSRAAYTRPRAEVERQIAELNGWDIPNEHATPEEKVVAELRQRLLVLGITRVQADDLLSRFDQEAINRQIEWLPFRNAKSPARFLLAAIEGDYDPPPPFRTGKPDDIVQEPTAAGAADSPVESVSDGNTQPIT